MPKITKLTRKNLHGVWCALLTPWTDRDELDAKRYVKEVRAYKGTGVNGIYTGGTTGEFYAQDDATYERITKITCDEAHAIGVPVQIGCSALSTRTTIGRMKVAHKAGADAYQIAIPFWLTLLDDELTRFVREIGDAAQGTPIILYLTGRSKRKIAAPLFGEIAAKVPAFIGTKDTGATPDEVKAMLAVAPDIAIFGGEDFCTRMPVGGRGGYCSVSGFNTRLVVDLYRLCAAGRYSEARPIHDAIQRMHKEVWHPPYIDEGFMDSALDRVQRTAGGVDVGLRCQSPYRSCSEKHLRGYLKWWKANYPQYMPGKYKGATA
ncbi:MAG: dihydrodipicolinate synthase family protein [Planctomycetes bacterium]|nr:dihydrodipicolinate synthase family protein [Planctomycetota bacterium]